MPARLNDNRFLEEPIRKTTGEVPVIDNKDEIQRKIRKYRSTLYTVGTGMIAFGLWSAVQIVLLVLNSPDNIFPDSIYEQYSTAGVMTAMIVITVLAIGISLGLFGFVGVGARAEGLGKKKSPLYIIVTVLLFLIHIVSVILYIIGLFLFTPEETSLLTVIVSIIVNVTATVVMAELIHAAFMIRKYERGSVKEKR